MWNLEDTWIFILRELLILSRTWFNIAFGLVQLQADAERNTSACSFLLLHQPPVPRWVQGKQLIQKKKTAWEGKLNQEIMLAWLVLCGWEISGCSKRDKDTINSWKQVGRVILFLSATGNKYTRWDIAWKPRLIKSCILQPYFEHNRRVSCNECDSPATVLIMSVADTRCSSLGVFFSNTTF